jgi:NADPH:quinone reductase-like Zn-dependent oxidoreductase
MKALVARRYGSADVLAVEELPVPEPGPGQIQVRVTAAGLNPADLRTLSGVMKERAPLSFPHVPGSDFAGTVTRVAPGVQQFTPDQEIFGFGLPVAAPAMAELASTPASLSTGAMAEYLVINADSPAIAERPAGLPAVQAATLPIATLTALPLLRAAAFTTGMKVLVIGAAGGVGGAVVPMLAARGVHVIATAIPEDEPYLRELGAAEVIDYRTLDTAAETLSRHPDGVDILVNLALPGTALPKTAHAVRAGGRLLNIAFPSPDPADFDLPVETVFTRARPGDLAEVAALALSGTLPSTVSRRYRLDEAARAYADLENTHVRGKLAVEM